MTKSKNVLKTEIESRSYLRVFKIKTDSSGTSLKWSDKVVSINFFLFNFETVLQLPNRASKKIYVRYQQLFLAQEKHRPSAHISLMNLRSVKSMGEVDEILITRRALHLEMLINLLSRDIFSLVRCS